MEIYPSPSWEDTSISGRTFSFVCRKRDDIWFKILSYLTYLWTKEEVDLKDGKKSFLTLSCFQIKISSGPLREFVTGEVNIQGMIPRTTKDFYPGGTREKPVLSHPFVTTGVTTRRDKRSICDGLNTLCCFQVPPYIEPNLT